MIAAGSNVSARVARRGSGKKKPKAPTAELQTVQMLADYDDSLGVFDN